MISKSICQCEFANIFETLAGLKNGNFSIRALSNPQADINLNALIEKVNELAGSLESKAKAEVQSNEQMHKLINSVPDLLGYWDVNLINIHANLTHFKFFGKMPDKIRGKHIREILGDKIYKKQSHFIQLAQKGQTQVYEQKFRLANGKGSIHCLIKYLPDLVNEQVQGLFIVVTDLTEVKKSEQQYKIVVETMAEGLVIQNQKSEILRFNPAALTILGLSEDQLLGRTSSDPGWKTIKADGTDFVGSEHPAVVALKTGQPVKGVLMGVLLPSGSRRWISINAQPYRVKKKTNGNIEGQELEEQMVLCTFTDVTTFKEREDEVQFILDALQIGLWKFDPIEQGLFWHKGMYEIFELEEKDFSGHYQAWESALTPEALGKAVDELDLALSGEKEFNTIYEIATKTRGKRIISGRGKVTRNEAGTPIMMYGINMDRTNELRAEHELKRLADENLAILKSAKFSIITTNLDGIITGFNEEAERILGYSANEIIGQQTPAIFHDLAEIERTANLLSEELGQEVPVGFQVFTAKTKLEMPDERQWTYVNKNGSRVQVKLNVTALKDQFNKIYGYMGIGRDLTKELKIVSELELERTKALRNSKLASLGEMSAGIAHEINNPLAIIETSLFLLLKFKDNPEKFISKVESIKKATHRISRIVQSLRKFSRSGDKSEYKTHSIAEIVNDALILTESKAKRHNAVITTECQSCSLVVCDEIEIEQVIVNLINNSIDAIKDQHERWIKISLLEEPSLVVFRITDSGKGIPEDIRAKLFDPFFTTKKVGEGTGLGLSITKGILDEHKARINVLEDTPNTCFEIRFSKVEVTENAP